VAQATIPIQVPSDLDITHWVLQRTNHISGLADLLSDCLPAPLNLQQSDIWAPGAFPYRANAFRVAAAFSISNLAHNWHKLCGEMLSK
jgi:hypothetical protein